MKFDIQNESINIPHGAEIEKATLYLYLHGKWQTAGSKNSIQVGNDDRGLKKLYVMTKPWDESSATWANLDGAMSTWGANFIATSANNWTNVWEEYDVTAAVQDFVSGEKENNGFSMGYKFDDFGCYYFSSEYQADPSKRPKLVVTYNPTGISKVNSAASDIISVTQQKSNIQLRIIGKSYSAEIVSLKGEVVQTVTGIHETVNLSTKNFAKGVYFCRVMLDGTTITRKFTISQ